MKWTAQSPDLSTIENLWQIIGENVCQEQPSTVTDLWDKIEQQWKKITSELCKKIVKPVVAVGTKLSITKYSTLHIKCSKGYSCRISFNVSNIFVTATVLHMIVLLFCTSKMCMCNMCILKYTFYSKSLFPMKF